MAVVRLAYALLLVCSNAAAACELPSLPVIPKNVGDNVAPVLLDVRRYSDSMVEYIACLRAELESAGGEAAPASIRSTIIARNNHAVDEHKAVTNLYAERVGPLANLRLAEYLDGESRDCLFGDGVVRTGVVNAGAVLFFLRGRQAYLNLLESTCPEVERAGSFFVGDRAATGASVSPAARGVINPGFGGARGVDTPLSSRVCDQDSIFPYREGSTRRVFACPLGRFYSISEDEALQILATYASAPVDETADGEAP